MTKVPTRTSISSAAPCSGRSRSSTAWTSGQPDPDDPQQRHPHRDRDPVAVVAVGAEDEQQREGGGGDEQDVEGGPEVGGDDHPGDGEVGGDLDRAQLRGHHEVLAQRDPAETDHRDREHRPAGDRDRNREEDPGERDRDAAGGLAAAPPRRRTLDRARPLVLEEVERRRLRRPAAPRRRGPATPLYR